MKTVAAILLLGALAPIAAAQDVVWVDPLADVDPRFFTTTLEADLGLVPPDLPNWYLPPIHARDLPPQAYRGKFAGRLYVPRGNSRWEVVFDPYLAPYSTRRLYFHTGFHDRLYHGQDMFNRPTKLLIVGRHHQEVYDPDWEAALSRTRSLKAVADAELRAGRPVRAALAYWRRVNEASNDSAAYLGLSDALLLLENYDFAGEAAREGLRADPRWLKAKIDKRGFFEDPKPLEKAIEKLRRHVDAMPNTYYAQFLLGYNLMLTGRAKEAIPHLRIAADAWPWDDVPRMTLAAAKARSGS
jgi:tetratricopeptide (TPR) repeat protein